MPGRLTGRLLRNCKAIQNGNISGRLDQLPIATRHQPHQRAMANLDLQQLLLGKPRARASNSRITPPWVTSSTRLPAC